MTGTNGGIRNQRIDQLPISIIDFETTGLTPGLDRAIELSIVRVDPGEQPRLIFDSLINPERPVAATEIHGITDDDVRDAPRISDVAGDIVKAVSGSVIAAYNVYFDIKFFLYELGCAGVEINNEPPHMCLMYLRPMLNLGKRCSLADACAASNIEISNHHTSSADTIAAAQLLQCYQDAFMLKNITTYNDLAQLKSYKFTNSWLNQPLDNSINIPPSNNGKHKSRYISMQQQTTPEPKKNNLAEYWDTLVTVLADLKLTKDEMNLLSRKRIELNLTVEQIRALHARAYSSAIRQFIDDQCLDDKEIVKLRLLHNCLRQAGYAPGD